MASAPTKPAPNYTRWSLLCIALSIPLAILFYQRRLREPVAVVRFATFNVALNRPAPGQLLQELRGGGSAAAKQLAAIVQRAQPDVLLLCEVDHDDAGAAAAAFADEYLAVSQQGLAPIRFEYRWIAPSNTGEPTGRDLDKDGRADGPGDAYGYGAFPGQYGMVLLSRHPILADKARTFRLLPWAAMPGALRPEGAYDDATWAALRLSSKSHWDVPIGIGGQVVHALCSHPTPPAFDGPEDRNGCRNHDEIRFWVDYLTPGKGDWIVDDAGARGGLPDGERFVVMGDLNCDPKDGDSRRQALLDLLAHPRAQDPEPRSSGGVEWSRKQFGANATHAGDALLDTGDFDDAVGKGPGNLRVDYVVPARSLRVVQAAVFWPAEREAGAALAPASDHRLVWVDVAAP
jgi:endonuclease/exonuclease/phosphatase family metal-dependent hydrolase